MEQERGGDYPKNTVWEDVGSTKEGVKTGGKLKYEERGRKRVQIEVIRVKLLLEKTGTKGVGKASG